MTREQAGSGERILIVDDSPATLEVMSRNLTNQGYQVSTAPSVLEAIAFLDEHQVDLVITDYMMPKISGLELMKHVRENVRDTEIIMITGYASVEGAVEAMKVGAEEYLSKPFTDEELFDAVRRALDKLAMKRATRSLPGRDARDQYGILGNSEAIRELRNLISKVASTPATVLVTGESGTGKELVARAVHYSGNRSNKPFVPVNCGGIPESLLESELFGYVKGAFTGAGETRGGFFHTADGGTIFLDEVGEMSLTMQVKLLRVLQEKEVTMLGSTRPQKVDIRVIAATNKDLPFLVQKGLFREDLYFRLNIITINTPPLRELGNDILLLTQFFTRKYAEEMGKAVASYSEKALEILRDYHWPGNVRELQNTIQRLVVMSDGDTIQIPDLPSLMRYTVDRRGGVNRTLEEVEWEHILNVLASVDNNKSRAADILGISRKTLHRKLNAMGRDEGDEGDE